MNPEPSSNARPLDRLAGDTRLDALANAVGPAVDAVFTGDDPARRFVSDALHGRWLGHPLHPLLTDIPIGAWTVGAVADLLALGGDDRAAYAGDVATTIGVAGGIGAALAGWAEWSDTKDDVRRLGIAHAALNAGALTLYAISLALRRTERRGIATAVSLLGYALVAGGGYLGGELAFGRQLGVRHTAEAVDPPAAFTRVAALGDVPDDGMVRVALGDFPLLLARTGAGIRAVSAVCTHRGAPLGEGKRDGDCVVCPWHGSRFAFADGAVTAGPATFPLPVFETRISGDDVEVRLVEAPPIGGSSSTGSE
jgi:nitrite reductase/ring-hydroxylating ferredoxin subunit/uncharacterized membrane protein